MAGPADEAIGAVGIIVHPSLVVVRSGRVPLARWLTPGSACGARVCDIPGQKISPAIRPAAIRAFRVVCDVTTSLAAGTKKMSDRKRKRPGARKGWSNMLIFLVGALGGVLMGGALCVRYLRREMSADIGPRLKRMQLQLDNIETELNIAITTRHAELTTYSPGNPYASGQHHHDR